MQSLLLYEKDNDKPMMSVVHNNIGLVYYKLKDYRMGLEHFNRSLEIKLSINDNFDIDILQINISLCHAYLGKLEDARRTLQPIVLKCPAKCDDNIVVSTLFASGIIWLKSDSLNKAENDLLQSYIAAKKNSNHRYVFDNIIVLSQIYLKQNDLASAERFLLEGEKMTEASHFDLEEMKLYQELCTLYKAQGNYKKLSFYQENYMQMKDSVSNDAQTNNLMRLHAEATKKENKIQLVAQEQALQLKDQIINKQLGINVLIGIAVTLLALLIYILIKIFLQRRDNHYLLIQKVRERSDELLKNQQSLKLAIEQRDSALARLGHDLNHSMQSIRSLCSAGSEKPTDSNTLRYFDEINITTLTLSNSLDSILTESKVA